MVVVCRYCQHKNIVTTDDSSNEELEYYVPCNYCGHKIHIQRPVKSKASRQAGKNKEKRGKRRLKIPSEFLGAGLLAISLVVIVFAVVVIQREAVTDSEQPRNRLSDGMTFDAAKAAEDVVQHIASTPSGVEAIEYYVGKVVELSRFQKRNGISDRIAEAAIKEWVMTTGNLDYDLERVKAICLRNAANGIPYKFLPESEK